MCQKMHEWCSVQAASMAVLLWAQKGAQESIFLLLTALHKRLLNISGGRRMKEGVMLHGGSSRMDVLAGSQVKAGPLSCVPGSGCEDAVCPAELWFCRA